MAAGIGIPPWQALVNRLSLSQRIQLLLGCVIGVVIVGVTAIGYFQTVNSLRDEAIEHLRSTTRTRSALESITFVQAQDNSVALREEYLRRLHVAGDQDPQLAFNAWFVRYPDGVVRVRPERDDHRRQPSVYIRPPIPQTALLRRQVLVAFDLLKEWGPAQTLRYFSSYIDLPGQSLIMFSPSVNWGKEADATTNNFDYPPVQNSAPDRNPMRRTLWTEVYYDDKARTWMVSVVTPIDDAVRWIGTASQDIAVDDLIRRTTNEFAPGTYNLVIDRQGRLVAHPRLMEQIHKSSGNLAIGSLGDVELQGIWDAAHGAPAEDDVWVTRLKDNYLGIGRIAGPDWYFVTVYPAAQVDARGVASARSVLLAGVLGLVLELALLAWILRRQVSHPLQHLTRAAQDVAEGRLDVQVPVTNQTELGLLARSFNSMVEALRKRDQALQASNSDLHQALQAQAHSQHSLHTSEAFRDTLLQTIPDVVFVKDLQGNFIAVNRAFEAVYGRDFATIAGRSDFDFLPEEQARYFADRDAEALAAGHSVVSEGQQRDERTGEVRLIETIKTPVRGADGQPIALLGIGRDITERRRAQDALQALNQDLESRVAQRTLDLQQANTELQDAMNVLRTTQRELVQGEKLASLGRMVAGLAHELNTPIGNALTIGTTMGDHARTLGRATQDNSLKRSDLETYLKATQEGVVLLERALRQASSLVASFKQVSADQTSERRREFDLATTVEEILSTLRPGLRSLPIQLHCDIPAGIRMDNYPGYLAQILSNLVINAKLHAFDDRPGGTILIQAEDLVTTVRLRVRDDGCGIDPAIREQIFDPFFTTKMGRGGTGLGLSIVHSIVTGPLCGTIQVQSNQPQGTCFVIDLPRNAPRKASASDVH